MSKNIPPDDEERPINKAAMDEPQEEFITPEPNHPQQSDEEADRDHGDEVENVKRTDEQIDPGA